MLYFNDFFNTKDYFVKNTDNGIVLELDLPGFKKQDVKVKLSRRLLSVEASNESRGEYSRTFTLPTTVDSNTVSSKLEDGVLCVTMQYKPESADKLIQVL